MSETRDADTLPTSEELERLKAHAAEGPWDVDPHRLTSLWSDEDEVATFHDECDAAFFAALASLYRAGRLVHTDTPAYRGRDKLALVGLDYAGKALLRDSDVAAALADLDAEAGR